MKMGSLQAQVCVRECVRAWKAMSSSLEYQYIENKVIIARKLIWLLLRYCPEQIIIPIMLFD